VRHSIRIKIEGISNISMRQAIVILFIGLFVLAACSSTGPVLVPPATATASPQPGPTEVKVLPTPMSPSQTVPYEDLQVVMSEAEITTSYLTEFDSTREPPAGNRFLWIRILLKNIGQQEQDLPAPEHFSVLNGTIEYKPIYGHRKDHADYMALTTGLVQGQEVDAWLRFDIPDALELRDLQFAFLPESSQVSTGFSSSEYSWGDHPIYLWRCAP
jgi:predicted small lipoprotein YifL